MSMISRQILDFLLILAYNNINKKIYLGAGFASGTGFGVAVSENIDNVTLNFEDLYMVNLKES